MAANGLKQAQIGLQYGIHRTPSLGEEGELSECVNLIPKNGELVNIQEPVSKNITIISGETLIAIHEVPSVYKHYVVSKEDGIYYFDSEDEDAVRVKLTDAFECVANTIGNCIILNGYDETKIYIWNGTLYNFTSQNDFRIDIKFGLESQWKFVDSVNDLRLSNSGSSGTASKRPVYLSRTEFPISDTGAMSYSFVSGKTYRFVIKLLDYSEEESVEKIYSYIYFMGDESTDWAYLKNDGTFGKTKTNRKSIPLSSDYFTTLDVQINRNWSHVYFDSNGYSRWDIVLYELVEGAEEGETLSGYHVLGGTELIDSSLFKSVNKFIDDNYNKGAKFVFPFLLRYAIKLTTGEYVCPSVPILMEPNTGVIPYCGIKKTSTSGSEVTASVRVGAFTSTLKYYIENNSIIEKLKPLSDQEIVESVCIGVSTPIRRFNQGATGNDIINCNVYEGYADVETLSMNLPSHDMGAYTDLHLELPKFDKTYEQIIVGDGVESKNNFYIIKELKISELEFGHFKEINLTEDDISKVGTTTNSNLIPDNVESLYDYSSKVSFSYNNRLLRADLKEKLPSGNLMDYMCGYDPITTPIMENIEVTVKKNGKEYTCRTGKEKAYSSNKRWFYFPDADATKAVIYHDNEGAKSKCELNLTRHPFLDGAYCLNESALSYTTIPSDSELTDLPKNCPSVDYENRVAVSASSQPLVREQTCSVPCGRILALSNASKALSQGQFGEFPLYAFCDDGVWALSVGDDGKITSKQPISRDVVTNIDSVTQLDGAVAFVTSQGLKIISGSETFCISESVDGFNVSEDFYKQDVQAFYTTYVAKDGHKSESQRAKAPFIDNSTPIIEDLQSAKLLYDYPHNLLHVFVENKNGHYVFDMVSKQWVMQYLTCKIKSVIPGYPLTTMQISTASNDNHDTLASYEKVSNTSKHFGYALTRPMSLGNPTARKLLYDIRTIGQKTSSDSVRRIAVYVSNDNYTWYKLPSLKAMSAKYYRLLIMTNMNDLETVSGVVAQYVEKYTDKLR